MSMRLAVVALSGGLLGMSALVLSTAPAAHAAPSAPATARLPDPTAGPGGQGSRTPLVVAHRGASGYAPENTLAAVDKADQLGVDWVENDVQRTKDGELIVMHDATLDRTTDVEEVFPGRAPWKVSDFTSREIARLDAGSSFSEAYAGERVPTLRQFLDRLERNGQRLLLELKVPAQYPGIEGQTLRALDRAGWLDGRAASRLVIQSFDASAVKTVHNLRPAVRTGYLGNPEAAELPGYAQFVDQINPRHSAVTKEYVRQVQRVRGAHGNRLEVNTWTVDDDSTARQVLAAGVDGIISNKPDVALRAIRG
ncbi:glycerophosphodiester phosphodiesterase [Streptomyces sp. AJS327]|uniref:glycerophosphodiester phosphodiesterase n=1 Tax=Streptomyces sp. AJS327 TaxID=2545265 RepID=UPI0015DDDAA1|nr:glycerophosphodiester phosphodiesterase family protein [Streptomyces sp. AJS327]MBA0050423.1 glycerophosphodiester phosphodiesterase [Streptomyces sp. AJS327]